MDRNEIPGTQQDGISVQCGEGISAKFDAGGKLVAFEIAYQTALYWCGRGDQFRSAIQNAALCVDSANARANARRDREAEARGCGVPGMRRGCNALGCTAQACYRHSE